MKRTGAQRRHAKRCAAKTQRRNSYASQTIAAQRAAAMAAKTTTPIREYLCPHCSRWHIGQSIIVDQWKKRTLNHTVQPKAN